jgi:hypothetical protein
VNISEFKNAFKGGGARANLFEVELAFPDFAGSQEATRVGKFMIKSAQLPPSTLGVIEQNYRGRIFKMPGDRIFPEWTITILNDTDFLIRNAFEAWSNGINTHEGNLGAEDLTETMVQMSAFQLDRRGNRIKPYVFKDLWPSEVSPIEVSHESTNQIQEYTVTLQYSEWVSDTTT